MGNIRNSKKIYWFYLSTLLYIFIITNSFTALGNDRLVETETNLPLLDTTDSLRNATDSTTIINKSLWLGKHELPAKYPFIYYIRINPRSEGYATIWFLASLILIALARYAFPVRFKETLFAAWEQRYFNFLERETGILNHWVSFLLFLNYVFSLSLLIFQSFGSNISHLLPAVPPPLIMLFYGLLVIAAFFTAKIALMYFSGWIFQTEYATETYIRHSLVTYNVAGITLLPILIIHYFNPAGWLLIISWIIWGLMELWRFFKIIPIGLQMKGFSVYHLILYLCAVEIIPLLLIIKYSQNTL